MEYLKLTYFGYPIYNFSDFERQNGMVPLNVFVETFRIEYYELFLMVGKNWEDKCEYENLTYFGWDPLLITAVIPNYCRTRVSA